MHLVPGHLHHGQLPVLNVQHQREAVGTDSIYSDTPAIDNGCKMAQLFIGKDSLIADAYPIKTDKQFVNTLEDNIRKRGAMDKLISDGANAETSKQAHGILRITQVMVSDLGVRVHYVA